MLFCLPESLSIQVANTHLHHIVHIQWCLIKGYATLTMYLIKLIGGSEGEPDCVLLV